MENCVKLYRQVQILSTMYNNIHQPYMVLCYLLVIGLCVCYPTFILVKGFGQMSFLVIALFMEFLLGGITITLFCWYYPIQILQTSMACISQWKLKPVEAQENYHFGIIRNSKYQNLLHKKYGSSFKLIRICMFNNMYFERITPFKLFNFFVQTSLKMILLGR